MLCGDSEYNITYKENIQFIKIKQKQANTFLIHLIADTCIM